MTVHPIVPMTEAALDAVARRVADGVRDADRVDFVIERAGDGLRAKLPLPPPVRTWIEHLALDELGDALNRAGDRLAGALVPASASDTEALDLCVSARDRAESVLTGVRRACLGSQRPLADVPNVATALDLNASVDQLLGARVGRHAVEQALGLRMGLLSERSWTHDMPLGAGGEVVSDVEWPRTGALARPSDTSTADYVERGKRAQWVEAYAATDEAFRETLQETIAAFRATGQNVGLVARRWMRPSSSHVADGASKAASIVPLGFALANAASSDSELGSKELVLGVLSPTDAEGLLVLQGARVVLTVIAGSMQLTRVALGDCEATAATGAGEWRVTAAATREPMTLVVETADGRRFEVSMGLFDPDDPSS